MGLGSKRGFRYGSAVVAVTGIAVAAASACSGDSEGQTAGAGTGGAGGDTSSANAGGSDDAGVGGLSSGSGGGSGGEGGSCAQTELEATLEQKPVDIVFAVGNNGSLAQEIAAVESNINQNFAQIIGNSGIDYRVIMVSESGGHKFHVCVEGPLGGVSDCSTVADSAAPVNNPPTFFHYSAEVWNDDSWCKLLSTFDGTLPDQYGQQPNGWSDWLRPEAKKIFVVLSDSGVNCTYQGTDLDDGPQQPSSADIPQAEQAAADFDTFLLNTSSTHFGTKKDRNYIWHSIVGLEPKDPNNPATAWQPTDPLSLVKCTDGAKPVSPGLGYQALSRLSGGLRFPMCESANYDVVFQTIAQGIVEGSVIGCEFAIPDPPPGETIDPDTVEIEFTPDGGMTQTFHQVSGPADCEPDAFYIESNTVHLCPDACSKVQAEGQASLDILFGCEIEIGSAD